MHIGVISPSYPYKGNSESVFVEAIVNEFIALGHQCTVIAPFTVFTYLRGRRSYGIKYEKRKVNNSFVEIYKPRVYGIKDYPIMGVSNSRFQETLAIEKTINRHKLHFDILYCHFFAQGFSAFRYAKNHDIPIFVATGESVIPFLNPPFRGFSIKSFRDYLSGTICVSTKNLNESVDMGYTIKEKCKVIPNAVNLDLFTFNSDKNALRDKLGLPQDKIIIISVGEFSDRKGQNRIIEAIASLDDPRIALVLIGKSLSSSYVLKQHPSIVFCGAVAHNNLPYYLHASDVFVLPTLKEGCCNAIIEAIACGLPIISSDLPFNYDILSKDSAILINPASVSEIATAIDNVVHDSMLRKSLAEASEKKTEQLSINQRAKKILDFISSKLHANT